MKKKMLTRALALIGAVFAVVSVAVVPTFANDENMFQHSWSDVLNTVTNGSREYEIGGGENDEWLGYGTESVFQYNEIAQTFFDKFKGSSGKYIIPVEYYKTVNGVNSLIDGYSPVSCPDYFDLSYCAVMVIRMNARGQIYRFWTYAENFKLSSKFDTINGDDIEVPSQVEQNLQIEYDVITTDGNQSWWQDTTEAGLPSYDGLGFEYWDRDLHVDYVSERCRYVNGYYWHELIYDTMRLHDTNASNYTLCYVVVSLEQLVIDYESKYAYSQGYNEGHTVGYDKGYAEGDAIGQEIGFDYGYSTGYDIGYFDGELATVDAQRYYWSTYYNTEAYGNAVQEAIRSEDSNPVTAFFNSIWNGILNAYETVSNGISVGGISLSMVITTLIIAAVVIFIVKTVR